jgi:hypothetical protein
MIHDDGGEGPPPQEDYALDEKEEEKKNGRSTFLRKLQDDALQSTNPSPLRMLWPATI